MTAEEFPPLTHDELEAQTVIALPDKEVASILDLNADLDLNLDVAAPIDLAVAANANVAAPIDAAVGANILSSGSSAQALADQGTLIDQGIAADATATRGQDSVITQDGSAAPDATAADPTAAPDAAAADAQGIPVDGALPDAGAALPGGSLPDAGTSAVGDAASALDGDLLNVDVNLAADADLAAPINGAVAANANVAAPIDAAVAANIGSVDSDAVAIAQQDAIINQQIDGSATANADQTSDLQQ
jgi:hypothetical protein